MQIIVRDNRDYAFDIYGSLNSTGVILTAFETFKPEVIRRIAEFQSPSKRRSKEYLDKIEEFLGSDKNTQSKTENLITGFALAESGRKCLFDFEDQRGYLRRRYNEILDNNEAERFVKRLLDTSHIHQYFWSDEVILEAEIQYSQNRQIREHLDEASFCLHYLSSAKHDIARALIARFYSFHELDKLGDNRASKAKIIDFCEAIKAIAAFFTLWRAIRPSTSGLDTLYRNIMSGGENVLLGYCYKSEADIGKLEDQKLKAMYGQELKKRYSNNGLKKIYRDLLIKNGIPRNPDAGKSRWIESSWGERLYSKKAIAKFILMIANHRTVPQPNDRRLLMPVDPGANATETVCRDSWNESQYESLEHIYPQNPDDKDDDTEIFSPQVIDRLGNLTLLPQIDNQALSNMAWNKKKLICAVLSSQEDNERQKAIEALKNSKVFKEEKIKILVDKISKKRCLPLTKTLTYYDKFGEDEIKARGEHLLGLAWDTLAVKWLGWEK